MLYDDEGYNTNTPVITDWVLINNITLCIKTILLIRKIKYLEVRYASKIQIDSETMHQSLTK